MFFRQLHLIISMLVHRDEDAKSEASTNMEKEREIMSVINSIFHCIKCSEDVVDAAKSMVVFISYSWLFQLLLCIIQRNQKKRFLNSEKKCIIPILPVLSFEIARTRMLFVILGCQLPNV